MIQIGQCAKDISLELKKKYPEVDWKGPAGFRDKMAHGYASINISRFRHTVLEYVPLLMRDCKKILDEMR